MKHFSAEDLCRVIEMAWEDRTPFEAIEYQFGLTESDTINLMRTHMQPGSFRLWRERVTERKTKHLKLRSSDVSRAYSSRQYKV
nr:TIGR03643 family protein [Acinetobacter baretiae]